MCVTPCGIWLARCLLFSFRMATRSSGRARQAQLAANPHRKCTHCHFTLAHTLAQGGNFSKICQCAQISHRRWIAIRQSLQDMPKNRRGESILSNIFGSPLRTWLLHARRMDDWQRVDEKLICGQNTKIFGPFPPSECLWLAPSRTRRFSVCRG